MNYRRLVLAALLGLLALALWASPEFKQVAAGVAIFLFGMLSLENGFRQFTGGFLESVLRRTTDTIPKSLGFGIVSTAIMQSSSLVSVITISFLSAGMLPLITGIGIIFGANLGTTTGAWLFATIGMKMSLSAFALPMLVFGVVLNFQGSRVLKASGAILAGLGFLFLGIDFMKDGFEGYQAAVDLRAYAITGITGLLVYTGLGILATVIMQSSHATLALTLAGLATGQITYENALALAIGANIGTTVTALIGGLGANIAGKRLAGAHLFFNLATAAMALVLVEPLRWSVDGLSALMSIADDDYTVKLAVFHTLFNCLGVAVMLPRISQLARALERWLPEGPEEAAAEPRYLNPAAMDSPDSANVAVRREVWHLFDQAFVILAHGLHLHREQICNCDDLRAMINNNRERIDIDIDLLYRQRVKRLYNAILDFISGCMTRMSPGSSTESLYRLQHAAAEMVEAIKHVKHLRKNLTTYLAANNAAIRREYNDLRLRVAIVLRETHRLYEGQFDDASTAILELDEIAVSARVDRESMVARVTKLLGTKQIDSAMATSLLNDSAYASETVDAILTGTRELLTATDVDAARTTEALSVSDEGQAGVNI
ncbi:Na/Pi symporter [Marinobacter sp. M216]|uniref:Na/Pi symporter n=1 Tax=Marinobacter albus TaxID=3030833 RepID=A0ABT7H938_9GAMM|nr:MULTISPECIES: Na/Pi symporter [unclassified Marinobacter]MBW7470847.1 Na/Pi symporter [Marinobacter sp. F4218]MDK9556883.1 Na/Pi symporter [Marinobacter sp. M216]